MMHRAKGAIRVRIVTSKILRTTTRNAAIQVCMVTLITISFSIPTHAADKSTAPQLIALANSNSPALQAAILATFEPKDTTNGIAWVGHGPDFFFAIQASSKPALFIDDAPGPQMRNSTTPTFWYAAARIEQLGKLHSFHYLVNGQKFGGRLDLPAFTPDSYQQPSVPPANSPTKSFTPAKSTTA